MSYLHELGVVLGMALITFGIRYFLLAVGARFSFPPLVSDALRYVPIAVLTAIIVPMILLPDDQHWQLGWQNASLVGALGSAIIAWRKGPLLAAIGLGMALFFCWPLVVRVLQ